jgi:hypothetical protein
MAFEHKVHGLASPVHLRRCEVVLLEGRDKACCNEPMSNAICSRSGILK